MVHSMLRFSLLNKTSFSSLLHRCHRTKLQSPRCNYINQLSYSTTTIPIHYWRLRTIFATLCTLSRRLLELDTRRVFAFALGPLDSSANPDETSTGQTVPSGGNVPLAKYARRNWVVQLDGSAVDVCFKSEVRLDEEGAGM